jgi:hypothetical protein
MPTYIGASADPVHSLLYLFLLFFYLPMGYPSRPPSLSQTEARRSSVIFTC